MLSQLTIHDFAIVDHLRVDWQPGFNVITGETGAGKSILIDSVGALLGDRLGPAAVRSGAARAIVEGIFGVAEPQVPSELQIALEGYGLQPEDGALIISRELAGSGGRGGSRINGRAVPLSALQQLGELMVDVHGQSQHMALLRAREQLDYLDRFAGALAERAAVAQLVRELRAVREARQQLLMQAREAARQQDMLRHQLAEIERAQLQPGEEDELLAQRTRLQHTERLQQAAQAAHAALAGVETDSGERPGAVDLLAEALAACQDGARFDASLAAQAEVLTAALAQAEDAAHALRAYLEAAEADPSRLEQVVERLFLITDLKRKYGESLAEVLAYAEHARQQLAELEQRDERLADFAQQEARLSEQLAAAAAALSRLRRAGAERLATLVERELAELRLGGARFCVAVQHSPDPAGLEVDGQPLAFDTTGIDRVEFQIATGSGEAPRSMARIASGGELARIALALKTILARAETRPTLIFDEVDVGVGGRTAPVVGEKLWSIAAAGRQVLCVTHLPQVAVYADAHYVVAREAGGASRVSLLDEAGRVEELAAMLAGTVTDTARQNARELLTRAAAYKAQALRGTARTRRG